MSIYIYNGHKILLLHEYEYIGFIVDLTMILPYKQLSLKEWNMFQIFSCHLIKYLFLEVINILISTGLFKQYEKQLF